MPAVCRWPAATNFNCLRRALGTSFRQWPTWLRSDRLVSPHSDCGESGQEGAPLQLPDPRFRCGEADRRCTSPSGILGGRPTVNSPVSVAHRDPLASPGWNHFNSPPDDSARPDTSQIALRQYHAMNADQPHAGPQRPERHPQAKGLSAARPVLRPDQHYTPSAGTGGSTSFYSGMPHCRQRGEAFTHLNLRCTRLARSWWSWWCRRRHRAAAERIYRWPRPQRLDGIIDLFPKLSGAMPIGGLMLGIVPP